MNESERKGVKGKNSNIYALFHWSQLQWGNGESLSCCSGYKLMKPLVLQFFCSKVLKSKRIGQIWSEQNQCINAYTRETKFNSSTNVLNSHCTVYNCTLCTVFCLCHLRTVQIAKLYTWNSNNYNYRIMKDCKFQVIVFETGKWKYTWCPLAYLLELPCSRLKTNNFCDKMGRWNLAA